VAILALLAAFVSGSPGTLVAPHADACFDIPLVVPAQEGFLVFRVRLVAFPAACRVALRPASETTDADSVLLAKRSHHATGILATVVHELSHIIANDLEIEHATMFSVGP
jgi:hypothetical protein